MLRWEEGSNRRANPKGLSRYVDSIEFTTHGKSENDYVDAKRQREMFRKRNRPARILLGIKAQRLSHE